MIQWKREVNNKMRWQGDIDDEKKIIRINKTKSKEKSNVLDTIIHEELHRTQPKLTEKQVEKKTELAMKNMIQKTRNKMYNRYK